MLKKISSHPIFKLVVGSGGGQIISVIALPFITRLYSPGQFGEVALISVLLGIVSSLAFFQADRLAVVESEQSYTGLFSFALLSALVIGVIGFGVAISMRYLEVLRYESVSYSLFLFLIPAMAIASGYRLIRILALRNFFYKQVGISSFLNSAFSAVGKLSFSGIGSLGLLAGDALGNLVTLFFLRRNLKLSFGFSFKAAKDFYTKNQAFLRDSQVSTFLNSIGSALPSYIISSRLGVAQLGLFAIAYRIVSLPVVHLGTAKSDFYNSKISEFIRNGQPKELLQFLKKWALRDFLLGISGYLLIAIVSPYAFPIIFGSAWSGGGQVVQILSIWMFGAYLVVPFSHILILTKKIRLKMIYDLFNLITLSAFFFASSGKNPIALYWGLSIVQSLTYVVYFVLILYAVKSFTYQKDSEPA
ncbi:lipopolysaccharide biosynthesis protein [Bdellovibrio reynosensis]|uniref:Oligosaccharide flippase family protein n=1 Tax=Bdellovibrio reynosensis TaxID=2835041 RepID=A0ABY4CCR4_9BACT|nr:oligosaccharide flippase family protein [Bdellovibrio reynosensis]UOF02234.1 oligosaccharide flippase family protein [Bdellovibrio reynosensis]